MLCRVNLGAFFNAFDVSCGRLSVVGLGKKTTMTNVPRALVLDFVECWNSKSTQTMLTRWNLIFSSFLFRFVWQRKCAEFFLFQLWNFARLGLLPVQREKESLDARPVNKQRQKRFFIVLNFYGPRWIIWWKLQSSDSMKAVFHAISAGETSFISTKFFICILCKWDRVRECYKKIKIVHLPFFALWKLLTKILLHPLISINMLVTNQLSVRFGFFTTSGS